MNLVMGLSLFDSAAGLWLCQLLLSQGCLLLSLSPQGALPELATGVVSAGKAEVSLDHLQWPWWEVSENPSLWLSGSPSLHPVVAQTAWQPAATGSCLLFRTRPEKV